VRLSKEYGYEHLVQDLVGPIFDSDRKGERLGRLLTGLRQWCLSGKHDEATPDGRPIPIDHNDAMMAFLMTSAAVSYLEQLPLEERMLARGVALARPRTRRRAPRPRTPSGDGAQPAPEPAPAPPVEAPSSAAPTPAPRRRRRRRSPKPEQPATTPESSPPS